MAAFHHGFSDNHRIVRTCPRGTIWASILRRTTAALSNIPPRPDGALGLRVVAPDAAIAALIRGPIEEGRGRGGSFREAGGGSFPKRWPKWASWAKSKEAGGSPTNPD